MKRKHQLRTWIFFFLWTAVGVAASLAQRLMPGLPKVLPQVSMWTLVSLIASILALSELFTLLSFLIFAVRKKPAVEGVMIGRLYKLVAALAIFVSVMWSFGQWGRMAGAFSLFGGMLLGWSLQAPVSGFAAWVLVSLKRPFRPGDRIQFPNLGLTGDVVENSVMYTVLNQVGGSIGSEEAVGRHILVPNAMLFSQVVINYTVLQEAAYMLDEVVVRITYDSDWNLAERILLDAAAEMTKDIIEATGKQPYIRSDLYDYGVFMRLRYQTRVKDRAEISYKINKRIFEDIQRTPSVDLAIPFVYSYRAGMDRKEGESGEDRDASNIQQVEIERIRSSRSVDTEAAKQVAESIAERGLLQPIVVIRNPDGKTYDLVVGDIRFEACKRLGWKTIPAVVKGSLLNHRG